MNIKTANRLAELREKNHLSQEALAENLGVSSQVISKWESADESPSMDHLIALAGLYRISLDDLLGLQGEIPAENGMAEEPAGNNHNILRHFPVLIVVTVLYIILGAVWRAWHPGWLVFFLPLIWESAVAAVDKKDARCFAYPLLIVLIYLCLGFWGGWWHPGWVLFLTIPLYDLLVNLHSKRSA